MNPCPCGHQGDGSDRCTCDPAVVARYRGRISGPLLDRIDLHVDVPEVKYRELTAEPDGEPSRTIAERVGAARRRQMERFRAEGILWNSQMGPRQLRRHCRLDSQARAQLESAVERLGLSARAFDRVLKVARTIADLADSPAISADHIAEAIQYRSLDRSYWEGV
jgi:magnesium chelatase family protein